jgi:hypothetical protein
MARGGIEPAANHAARDSARYSIVTAEWPAVKQRMIHRSKSRGSVEFSRI